MAAFEDMQTNFDDEGEEENDDFDCEEKLKLGGLSPNIFLYPKTERKYVQQKQILEENLSETEVSYTVDVIRKYYKLSLRFVNAFCENVVSHPCTVLRRQCQVHQKARRYHLIPFTLIPIIIKIQGRQGLSTLWKGIGSVFVVRGLAIVCEDVMSKLTQWPKDIDTSGGRSLKKVLQHLFLKFITVVIVTPFYSASLVETVQSDIASEKPGVLDCIVEGLGRVFPHKHHPTSRVVPVWILAFPTASHGVLRYAVSSVVQRIVFHFMKPKWLKSKDPNIREDGSGYAELSSALIGSLVSDVLLYPLETVIHRLHIQGTRTIVDNLDSGFEVTPIVTKYEGPVDCFQSIVAEEGAAGLFKGFGALLIQYAIHATILKMTKFAFEEFDRNYGRGRVCIR